MARRTNPPFSDRGISVRGCGHHDTWVFTVATNSVAVIKVKAGRGSTSVERVEWCRDCGGLRFAKGERFVVPMRNRVGSSS